MAALKSEKVPIVVFLRDREISRYRYGSGCAEMDSRSQWKPISAFGNKMRANWGETFGPKRVGKDRKIQPISGSCRNGLMKLSINNVI